MLIRCCIQGDGSRYNPEDFLLASVSSCHMLWYLHLCADNGITVVDYNDTATGVLQTGANQPGKFVAITLHPNVTITEAAHIQLAHELHHKANTHCFIANTLNLEIKHIVTINALTK
jgi:organic hydroperoxide reductase OsmC/OhrA